jgi:DNA-binding response OmpR family regulator
MAEILVMDDVEYVRTSVKNVLEKNGHTVFTAADGVEGEEILKEKRIDLVITDIVMPRKGGVEALFDLRRDHKSVKIIIMTGKVSSDSEAFKNLVNQFGATEILYKPFQRQQLIDAVNTVLGT